LPARTRVYGYIFVVLLAGGAPGAASQGQGGPELDCGHPAQARAFIAQLQMAEIEGAEDIHREAMWNAFGRCPAGDTGGPCRREERRRFEAQWEAKRREIEAKYREVLGAFEQRCRAIISVLGYGVRAAS